MTQFNTLQELFQFSVEKLAKQAKRSVKSGGGLCLYFTSTYDGEELRCAIGHVMPESLKPVLKNVVVGIDILLRDWVEESTEVAEWAESIKNVYNPEAFDALQGFHDDARNWETPETFLSRARHLFSTFGLTLDENKLDFSNWQSKMST